MNSQNFLNPLRFFSESELSQLKFRKPFLLVSGGSDSTFLFRLFLEIRARYGAEFSVLHVNHGLRGAESDGDEAFVRDLCARNGVPCEVRRASFSGKGNLQEKARRFRLGVCAELARAGRAGAFFTAHQRDDVLETLLMRRARGTGWFGLSGIRRERALPGACGAKLARPLLEARKSDLEEALRGIGQGWRVDSSNASDKYFRNRVRRELAGRAASWTSGGEAERAIAASRALGGVSDYFEARARELARRGRFVPLGLWESWPEELRFRVFALKMRAKGARGQVGRRHFEALREGDSVLSLGSARAFRDASGLFFYSVSELESLREPCVLPDCGAYFFGKWGKTVRLSRVNPDSIAAPIKGAKSGFANQLFLDAASVRFPLRLEAAGEYGDAPLKSTFLASFGRSGTVSLKDLFQERGVPLYSRRFVPLVRDASGRIVAVLGVEIDASCAVGTGTRESLGIGVG